MKKRGTNKARSSLPAISRAKKEGEERKHPRCIRGDSQ